MPPQSRPTPPSHPGAPRPIPEVHPGAPRPISDTHPGAPRPIPGPQAKSADLPLGKEICFHIAALYTDQLLKYHQCNKVNFSHNFKFVFHFPPQVLHLLDHLLLSPLQRDHLPCRHPCSPNKPPLPFSPSCHHQCSPPFQLHCSHSKLQLLKQDLLLLTPLGLHRVLPLLNPPHAPAPLTLCRLTLQSLRQPQLHRLVPTVFS